MSAAIIGNKFVEILLPISMVKNAKTNVKLASAKVKMNKGMDTIQKGVELTLSGVDDLVDEQINRLLDTEDPSLSDQEAKELQNVLDQASELLSYINDLDMPASTVFALKKSCEKLDLMLNLEMQMRENLALPATINLKGIEKAVNSSQKDFGDSWVEA